MPKYRVHLNAFASASVDVEADSAKEAYEKALDETDGYAEASFTDWDHESGEVEDEDGNYYDYDDDFKEIQ